MSDPNQPQQTQKNLKKTLKVFLIIGGIMLATLIIYLVFIDTVSVSFIISFGKLTQHSSWTERLQALTAPMVIAALVISQLVDIPENISDIRHHIGCKGNWWFGFAAPILKLACVAVLVITAILLFVNTSSLSPFFTALSGSTN